MGNLSRGRLGWWASIQVPHAWFTHFYILSVLLSVFWVIQFLCEGSILKTVLAMGSATKGPSTASMSLAQVMLVWGLMSVHGCRRLYECLVFTRPSQAKMWVGHWLFGLTFYAAMSVAVWVDGIRKASWEHQQLILLSSCFSDAAHRGLA